MKNLRLNQIIAHKGNTGENEHKIYLAKIIEFDRLAIRVETKSGERYYINSWDICKMPTLSTF